MQVINKVLVTVVSGFLLSFGSINVFAEECRYTNVNNVIQPSAQYDKDSICNSQHVQTYDSLFYYSGEKAVCNENKAIYCAKLEERRNNGSNLNSLIDKDARRPLEEQYWVKAFSYCGLDYKAENDKYCEHLASKGKKRNKHAEKNCKPAQLAALVNNVCSGGRSYSAYDEQTSAWCGKHYKKADPRSKKLSEEPAKDIYDNNSACNPREISYASSKPSSSSGNNNNSSSSSSNSSSSSSNSSSGSTPAPENTTPQAPAGVDDALNKAKKLKDMFGF